MPGRAVEAYRAPLFFAWQHTNRCRARCLACCEESGPDLAWSDELSRDEATAIARAIAGAGVPYVAFGGGEPLGVPHAWELFELLAAAGIALKLETDGSMDGPKIPEQLQLALDMAKAGGMKDLGPAAEIISTQFKPVPTKF